MNKFFTLDKENVLYPILILSLIGMVIVPLLSSCGASFEETKQENANKGVTTIGGKHNKDFVYEYPYKGHTYMVVGNGKWGCHAGHCPCNQNSKAEK